MYSISTNMNKKMDFSQHFTGKNNKSTESSLKNITKQCCLIDYYKLYYSDI